MEETYKIIGGEDPEGLSNKVNQERDNDPSWKVGPFVVAICGKFYQILYKDE